MPDTVNPQINDAVTQTNVEILGDAPSMAMGSLYQATAQALANAAHNATVSQQNDEAILEAAATQGVALLYGVDTATTALGIEETISSEMK